MKTPKATDLDGRSKKREDDLDEFEVENTGLRTCTGNNEGTGTFDFHSSGHSGNGTGTGDNPGVGTAPDGGNEEYPKKKENGKKTSIEKFKEVDDVSMRVIAINANNGMYKLLFTTPNTAKKVKLEFSITGEQYDSDLEIKNASILQGSASITAIENNSIYISGVKKAEKMAIAFEVDFSGYCMMEVDYNESKK